MSTSASNVKVTILTWLVKMTHKISCCSTLCRFMLKIVTRGWTLIVTKKRSQSQNESQNFHDKRFVQITHGNIVASRTLVLATPRFELNWVSKACVSIFPSTHEVVRTQQITMPPSRRLFCSRPRLESWVKNWVMVLSAKITLFFENVGCNKIVYLIFIAWRLKFNESWTL